MIHFVVLTKRTKVKLTVDEYRFNKAVNDTLCHSQKEKILVKFCYIIYSLL